MRHSIEAKIQRCVAHFERHYGRRNEMEAFPSPDGDRVTVRDLQTREYAYYDISWWRIREITPARGSRQGFQPYWREVEKKETAE